MEIDRPLTPRLASFAALAAMMLLLAGGMTWLLYLATHPPDGADEAMRRYLMRLAWVCLVLLGLVLLLLLWVVLRFVKLLAARTEEPFPPTPYVDAWAAAGQRFRLQDQDQEQDDEPE